MSAGKPGMGKVKVRVFSWSKTSCTSASTSARAVGLVSAGTPGGVGKDGRPGMGRLGRPGMLRSW